MCTPSSPSAAQPRDAGRKYKNVATHQEPARPTPVRHDCAPLEENARTSSRRRNQHGPLRPAPLQHHRAHRWQEMIQRRTMAHRWKKMIERRHATEAHSVSPPCGTTARAMFAKIARISSAASTAYSVLPLRSTTPRGVGIRCENVEEPTRPTPSSPRVPIAENTRTSPRPTTQHGPLRPAPLRHDPARQ